MSRTRYQCVVETGVVSAGDNLLVENRRPRDRMHAPTGPPLTGIKVSGFRFD